VACNIAKNKINEKILQIFNKFYKNYKKMKINLNKINKKILSQILDKE